MLAAASAPEAPLVLSTWGNDLTLHAPATPLMRWATRRALVRAAGLHADCARDERLARARGFAEGRPSLVAPGNGGVRREIFHSKAESRDPDFGLPAGAPVVVQPRGLRAYVRSDTFFRSIPRLLEAAPATIFVCPAMEGLAEAEAWRARLEIGDRLRLLPTLDAGSMAALFRRAAVSVSPSTHDGTPNTLLEAMACGSLPAAGDLESIREWIRPEENGLLFDPTSSFALAEAVERGLKDDDLRERARRTNAERIAERADYDLVMPRAVSFYEDVLRAGPPGAGR
jgi:glycosyltransferase involved in cell wall biosynthesis